MNAPSLIQSHLTQMLLYFVSWVKMCRNYFRSWERNCSGNGFISRETSIYTSFNSAPQEGKSLFHGSKFQCFISSEWQRKRSRTKWLWRKKKPQLLVLINAARYKYKLRDCYLKTRDLLDRSFHARNDKWLVWRSWNLKVFILKGAPNTYVFNTSTFHTQMNKTFYLTSNYLELRNCFWK